MPTLTHLSKDGSAKMVDVSNKPCSIRKAVAQGWIKLNSETLQLVKDNLIKKGDVLAVARVAGIMGGKRTAELIPLCHNISINNISVDFEWLDNGILIKVYVCGTDKTGVEMEALTAVSLTALTIYDMCKAIDKDMVINDIQLVYKTKEDINEKNI